MLLDNAYLGKILFKHNNKLELRDMNPFSISNQVMKITLPTPFPVGDVNAYLIKGDRLTLIDTGVKTKESWHSFSKQLNDYGYTPNDIEQIIITHHHPDHVGMLDYFDRELPVYGHPFNKPWLNKDPQFMQNQMDFFKRLLLQFGLNDSFFPYIEKINDTLTFSCNRELKYFVEEGTTIAGLLGWIVLETPGHAQSHIVLYHEKSGVLIGGDLLLKDISPNPLLEPPMAKDIIDRPKPQLQLNESLTRLLQWPISAVYPGHGEVITDVHHLITYRLKKQRERADLVLEFLKNKPMTAFDVSKTLFPTVYVKQLMLTLSETVGQLDYLQEIGQIKIDETNETYLYYAT